LKSEDGRKDRRRDVVETTRNTFRSVMASIGPISAQQQSVASSEKAVEASRVGLRIGIRNTSDVLNAQRQLYDALRDYNKARYDYVIGTLALMQAVGTLDRKDLSDLNRYMLPAG
jgi:outer membrane protein